MCDLLICEFIPRCPWRAISGWGVCYTGVDTEARHPPPPRRVLTQQQAKASLVSQTYMQGERRLRALWVHWDNLGEGVVLNPNLDLTRETSSR